MQIRKSYALIRGKFNLRLRNAVILKTGAIVVVEVDDRRKLK
jgi:hypothetical protein